MIMRKQLISNHIKPIIIIPDINTGISELDTKRLLDALDTALQANGYTLSETPDFFIDIKSQEYQEAARNNVGVGLGGTGGNVGGGISIGIPIGQNQLNRQIIFEFVDESNTDCFGRRFQNLVTIQIPHRKQREALFKALVTKVLKDILPNQKTNFIIFLTV